MHLGGLAIETSNVWPFLLFHRCRLGSCVIVFALNFVFFDPASQELLADIVRLLVPFDNIILRA
jgi:hypothetical protein